jgi:hypothetical protein
MGWYGLDSCGSVWDQRKVFIYTEMKRTSSVVLRLEVLATDPEVRDRFPALPDFLRSSKSGTGSTQSREYN